MTVIVIKDPTNPQASAFINFVTQSGANGIAILENVTEFEALNNKGYLVTGEDMFKRRIEALEQKVDYLMSVESDRINAQLGSALNSNMTTEIFDAIFGRTDHDNHD